MKKISLLIFVQLLTAEAYGSDLWNFPSDWRSIMKYPGACQLGHFIKFFESIPWWTLNPDIKHQAAGFQ